MHKFQFSEQFRITQSVGDGPLDVPFFQILQWFFRGVVGAAPYNAQ